MLKQLMNWFRLRDLERDLNRELKYHIDRRMNDLILSGLSEPEARRQATLELGGGPGYDRRRDFDLMLNGAGRGTYSGLPRLGGEPD